MSNVAEAVPTSGNPVHPVDPITGRTFGDVVPTRSRADSKIESQVRAFLAEQGYPVPRHRVGVLCHHTDPKWPFLTLTPDVVLADLCLAIEVDPCGRVPSHRGSSHRGQEGKDRLRNELLAAVGWTVLRLRLEAREGDHVGERDVVVESSSFTKAAQSALLEAVEDFVAGLPSRVRFVPMGKSPKPAQRRSHIVRISLDHYSDDTYWFTWFPSLEGSESYMLRLAVGGRYLYCPSGRGSFFVDEVGLHEVDQAAWKERLTAYLAGKVPAEVRGATKWPWGDTLLLLRDPADPIAAEIAQASDHEKQTIDRVDFWFTVSGNHIASWSPYALDRDGESSLVTVHPAAFEAGYRFAGVTLDHGYRGPYQRVVVSRAAPTGDGESW